jgi:hypothetical protein
LHSVALEVISKSSSVVVSGRGDQNFHLESKSLTNSI